MTTERPPIHRPPRQGAGEPVRRRLHIRLRIGSGTVDPAALICRSCGSCCRDRAAAISWARVYDDRPPRLIPFVCPRCAAAGSGEAPRGGSFRDV